MNPVPLIRSCALAVLNSGVSTDDSLGLFAYPDFDMGFERHSRGLKVILNTRQHKHLLMGYSSRPYMINYLPCYAICCTAETYPRLENSHRPNVQTSFSNLRNASTESNRELSKSFVGRTIVAGIRLHTGSRPRTRSTSIRYLHRLRPGAMKEGKALPRTKV